MIPRRMAAEKAQMEKNIGTPVRNESLRLVAGWTVVGYDVVLDGAALTQKNLRACKIVGDAWVDVHLSVTDEHAAYTGSDRAKTLLERWETSLPQFVKVVSLEYRRVQTERQARAAVG